MKRNFLKKFTKKGFIIQLDDEYRFPNQKNFIYPNTFVMQAAIENYCIKQGDHLEYISKEKPISFILNNRTKYNASLHLCRGRFYSGYNIKCTEIID